MDRKKGKDFSVESFSTSAKIWIESMMVEYKAVVTEKNEFEKRCESVKLTLLELSDYQVSDAGNRTKFFSFDLFTKKWRISIETLVEEAKSVVMGRHKLRKLIFPKTNCTFFELPAVHVSNTKYKANKVSMKHFCTKERFPIGN